MSKPAWTTHLVVKLVRGLPGTKQKHRTALVKTLGIPKRGHSVVVKNTPTVLGLIEQVKRLVEVETLEMYMERIQNEILAKKCRPPFVMRHNVPVDQGQESTQKKTVWFYLFLSMVPVFWKSSLCCDNLLETCNDLSYESGMLYADCKGPEKASISLNEYVSTFAGI
ncbi:hypothetical protein SELMODRAFT_420198 [Selaginella moellendorffii]|uniref:Large ribosomal subunit protein uL30m n=1 Tax=Selaginella moellendorffii TaxID=88036 RepID=D8SB93_SELML|nr:hypothetical protein SELMODRAFT_420198 [Selaginella moellendorffii]